MAKRRNYLLMEEEPSIEDKNRPDMPKPKIAVGYLRVSTKQQAGEDRMGRDAQKQAISKYAKENNYIIIRWYTDEESGVKEHREALDEILFTDELEKAGVQAVIAYKSDRFARDIKLYFYYLFTLEKRHISLVSVNERFDNDEYGLSSVYRSLMLFVAEQERKNIIMRTTGGRKVKAQKGGYAGGRVPYGYNAFNHKLIINEDEAEVVRLVFLLREQDCSMQEISDVLNDRGFRTRRGRYFCTSVVASILKNIKFYQGFYKYGEMKDYVKGQHEPIIAKRIKSMQEVDEILNQMERKEAQPTEPKRPTYEVNVEDEDEETESDYDNAVYAEPEQPVSDDTAYDTAYDTINDTNDDIEPENDHIEIGADIDFDEAEETQDEPQELMPSQPKSEQPPRFIGGVFQE